MKSTARRPAADLPLVPLVGLLGLLHFAAIGASGPAVARAESPPVGEPPVVESVEVVAPSDRLPLDPALLAGRLDNGLTYLVRENRRPEGRAELWLVVDAGSLLEDDDQRGLAHFVEHMAFNGTTRFAEDELVDYLETIGMQFGPDVNAYTTFDETVYMLRVPTDEAGILDKGLDILEDWAGGIAFDPAAVDRERGVLVEEWRRGRGVESRLLEVQIPLLFAGSRYAERLPVGERPVLETAPPALLERFYRDWYRPDLMAVIAVGDFDGAEIVRAIRRRFSDLAAPAAPRPRPDFSVPGHAEPRVGIVTDPEMTVTVVSIFDKLAPLPEGTARDYRRGLVERLFHRMLSDRLYELGQRPDAPFLYAASQDGELVRGVEVVQQVAVVREGEVLRGLEALAAEVERLRRHGFTAGELARAKQDLLLAYERTYAERESRTSGSYAAEYVRHFLEDEPTPGILHELELARAMVPAIGLEEVDRRGASWTDEADRAVLVTAPAKAAAGLPDEAEIRAVLARVASAALEPWRDTGPVGPLMAEPPAAGGGEIVERRRIEEVGVTEWRLSNGALVVAKPTTILEDEILFSAWSPGGHSRVTDADHLAAVVAAEGVAAGGLGEHSALDLEKVLAGRVAAVEPWIDELDEGVDGLAAAADLEPLLQLVHLSFARPRRDEAAYGALVERLEAVLADRLADPETRFREELVRKLTGDHPRRQPLTAEGVAGVRYDDAWRIYRERFADAGDFTFLFVGSFTLEQLEPLVERYLATLPGSPGEGESHRDLGVRRPAGGERFVVRAGSEPRATVYVDHGGLAEWSERAAVELEALAVALEIRLRETLRERMSGVYAVSVSAALDPLPVGTHSLAIEFTCDPERVDDLLAAVRRQVVLFRRGDIPQDLAEKVRTILLREHELAAASNEYWLDALRAAYRLGRDPRRADDRLVHLVATGRDRLRDAARRYLDPKTEIVGVLLPVAAGPAAEADAGRP